MPTGFFNAGSLTTGLVATDNVDFSGASSPAPTMTVNGQLLIGNTAGSPHIRVGNLTSPLGTIAVGYSAPNITLDLVGGGGAVEHLTGNTGGQLNPDGSNNFNIVTANSNVLFSGSGSTLTQDFGLTNNLFLGWSVPTLTIGQFNTGVGYQCFNALTSGVENSAYGSFTLLALTSGNTNSAYGMNSMNSLLNGNANSTLGYNSGNNLVSGSSNIYLGMASGGSGDESNIIRIGRSGSGLGQQNKSFIAGIYNTTPAGSTIQNVVIDNNGQLGAGSGNFNNYVATAISYQVLVTNSIIGVTNTSAARTITMPNSGMSTGQVWTIKDESGGAASNNITVSGNGVNIDGSSNFIINSNYGAIDIYWNGTKFFVK